MKKLRRLIPVICLMTIIGCDEVKVSVDPTPKTEIDVSDRDFAARRDRLGRKEKFRIMVDKVLVIETKDYRMTEDHVRTFAKAGFNVVVPRGGAGDVKDVRRMTRLARKHNVFYMPWMGHMVPPDKPGKGEKIVWASGTVQDKHNPNSDKLWEWMTRRIVGYAEISKDNPALIGVFLDFENYAGKELGSRWLYELSYDSIILAEFAKARGIKIPSMKTNQRYAWLVKNKLHDSFQQFQVCRWRSRCRSLRRKVDAINPKFQFFIYPNIYYSLFMREAAFREFGTKKAPIVVADYHNYFLPNGWHRQTMANARWMIDDAVKWVKNHAKRCGVKAMVIGGIDPISDEPMDPEYHGRNAAVIADRSDGYWVFYEFKKKRDKSGRRIIPPVNSRFIRWWTRANRNIAAGRAKQFWKADRETPEVGGPLIRMHIENPTLVTIKLNCPAKNVTIRYTATGKEPTTASRKYSGPFRVTKTATIRAAVFKKGKRVGIITSRTVRMPLHVIEAESVSFAEPWVVRTSGRRLKKRTYITVPKGRTVDISDPEDGELKYHFKLPDAGFCRLALLTRGPLGTDGSFYVKINDGPFMDWHTLTARKGWYWKLYPGVLRRVKRGVNTLTIRPRGAGAMLDKIAIIKAK